MDSKRKNLLKMAAVALTLTGASTSIAMAKSNQSSKWQEPVWPKYTKHVTLHWWMWTTDDNQLIKAFNKVYPNIKIVHTNVANEYTKLTTVLKAGTGAPDDVQVEYQYIPQFLNTGGLLDISKYDSQYKKYFPEWVWNQVNIGGKLYAMPEDVGPLGLLYRPDIFKKYHLTYPTTYAQFAADAIKLHKENPKMYLSFFGNDGGYVTGLFWQAGAHLFQNTPNGWKIDFTSPQAKKVVDYWGGLVNKGVIKWEQMWTPQWGNDIGKGEYASVIGAAWSANYEISPYVKKGTQQWKAGYIPQWDPKHPSDGNWGGSTVAVTTQTKNPEAAALFAAWVNMSHAGIDIGNSQGGYFTVDNESTAVPAFNTPVPFLGGQNQNAIFAKESNWVNKSFQWSPWTQYVYSEMNVEFSKAAAKKESWDQALQNIQNAVIQFARTQGYQIAN